MTTTSAAGSSRPWSALPLFARVSIEQESSTLLPFSGAVNVFGNLLFPEDTAQTTAATSSSLNTLTATLPTVPSPTDITTPSPTAASSLPSPADSLLRWQQRPPSRYHDECLASPLTCSSAPLLGDDAEAENTCRAVDSDHLHQIRGRIELEKTGENRVASTFNPLKAFGVPLYGPASPAASPKAWRCGFPGCASQVAFTRGCDLHKHYRRHLQRFFCRVDECPRSDAGSSSLSSHGRGAGSGDGDGGCATSRRWFASKKDRDRHEAKHSPRIRCSWRGPSGEQCNRVFSRLDNMKDHVRRVHRP